MLSHIRNNTLVKYLLSYFLIISLLLTSFLFIAKLHFENIYTESLYTSAEEQVMSIDSSYYSEISAIHQIQYLLEENKDLILYRHTESSWNHYLAQQRMEEYTTANNLLLSICVVNPSAEQVITSNIPVFQCEGGYNIYYNGTYIYFPLEDYLSAQSRNQLILLESGEEKVLVYLPYRNLSYSIFYILDINELYNILSPSPGFGIASICLLNSDKEIITGYKPDILLSHIEDLPAAEGLHTIDSSEAFYVMPNIIGECSIVAVISNQEIVGQVHLAMSDTYLFLMVLSVISLVLIFLAMRTTYLPLHKLIQKIAPSTPTEKSYTDALESTFTELTTEKKTLQKKLDSYRLFMQKSLLDSIIGDNTAPSNNQSVDLDTLFSTETDHHIYIAKFVNPEQGRVYPNDIYATISKTPKYSKHFSFTLIEHARKYSVFLIYSVDTDTSRDLELRDFLYQLYEKNNYQCILSNVATSPLEIPSLYENMMTASKSPTNSPVITFENTGKQGVESNTLQYPFASLEALASHLKNHAFYQAREVIQQLFNLLDNVSSENGYFASFFVRCVLIDCLTALVNVINELNIKFNDYNELYFSTLSLCRICSYTEKRDELYTKMLKFVDLYENTCNGSPVMLSQIMEILEQEYTSPDFSITVLTDRLHISSIPYMSFLFKKFFGENFSDYLWNMRLEKAKFLLLETDMSIEQISVNVGYLNATSFRRKFKQETGITPSQYRVKNE